MEHQTNTVDGDAGLVLVLEAEKVVPQKEIVSIFQTRVLSQCMYLVAEHGIANHVSSSTPISIKALAEKLSYNEEYLRRFVAYLASFGLFKLLPDGDIIGTPKTDLLRDDVPGNCRTAIRFLGCQPMASALTDMEFSLKTGGPSFQHANGLPIYEYFGKNPQIGSLFERAMPEFNPGMMTTLAEKYDMGRFNNVTDLGGGRGVLVKEILSYHPTLKRATLFEIESAMPHVLPELSNEPRFLAITGSFFNPADLARLPSSEADLFITMNAMHSFNDEDAAKILRNVASVMNKGSRLLIVEHHAYNYKPNVPSNEGMSVDMLMMLLLGGKQRDVEMWRQLLAKCNLQLTSGEGTAGLEKFGHILTVYECKLAN